jgi:hypothetical protein
LFRTKRLSDELLFLLWGAIQDTVAVAVARPDGDEEIGQHRRSKKIETETGYGWTDTTSSCTLLVGATPLFGAVVAGRADSAKGIGSVRLKVFFAG